MDDREVVLSIRCSEPDGDIVRSVRLTHLDTKRIKFLWERLGKFDVLFNDFTEGDFKAFFNHFITVIDGEPRATGLMWDVDDVGLFFLNNIKPCVSASAHFVFWDRRFRGREALCREMVRYALEEYKLQRMEVRVPLYANFTMNAVERIGFIHEGRLRSAIPYKGEMFDVNMYSIIPKDLEGEQNNGT